MIQLGKTARRGVGVACVLVALAAASGCYSMHASLPGTWRRPPPSEDVAVLGRVDVTTTHVWFLGGLVPPPSPDLYSAAVLPKVAAAGGDGIANVVIDTRFEAMDVALSAVTLGIVSPRTYRIRADIVRLSTPAPPGRPVLRGVRAGPARATTAARGGAP